MEKYVNNMEFEGMPRDMAYPGWALAYVEAEQPIPETYRSDFYDELVHENDEYRKKLELSVRKFGVRWAK